MKRVLFIIPPYSPFSDYTPDKNFASKIPTLALPYGLLSIISYCKSYIGTDFKILDLNTTIINCQKEKDYQFRYKILEQVQKEVLHFNPDIIGVSALCNTAFTHLEYLIPSIKKVSKAYIIIGGGLATNLYSELFTMIPSIDAICYGEGEIPFKKLLSGETSNAIITSNDFLNHKIPEHEFVENLNDIPIIKYDIMDYTLYNNRSLIEKEGLSNRVELYIHTSRGCPFSCIFCANGKTHGKKIRFMSTAYVIETIEYYIQHYNLTSLIIEDDHFLFKKDRALKILEAVKNFNLKVEFPNGIAVYRVDDDISKALSEAGVDVVPLAIESGSDYVLKEIINKPLKVDQIYTAIISLKKFNIKVHAFIVIGFPNETDSHRRDTLDMLLKSGVDWAYIFIAIPSAGSRLFDLCKENGYLTTTNYNNFTTVKCNISAPGVDPEQIEKDAYYFNIVVNFILNSNFINGNYSVCDKYWNNVVANYKNHAIAYYMLWESSIRQGNENSTYYDTFKLITNNETFWNSIIQRLKKDGLGTWI